MKIKIYQILLFLSRTALVLVFIFGLLFAGSLLPIKGNYKLYAVMSGSMTPEIPVGSLAFVMPKDNYKPGDIITFITYGARSDKDTTTHRIVSVARDGGHYLYDTKGDANENQDSKPVREANVIGKYIFGIAAVGYLLKYIFTLPGLVILILIPAMIIIISELMTISSEINHLRQRRAIERIRKV